MRLVDRTKSWWLVARNRDSQGREVCLDDKDWATAEGAALQLWPCWDAPVQQWTLYPVAE